MLRRPGLEDTGLSSHSMRHSFACWHIVRGRNSKSIQQQLGHATITITITYNVLDGREVHLRSRTCVVWRIDDVQELI